MSKAKRPALGRGLSALLPTAPQKPPAAPATHSGSNEGIDALRTIAIEHLVPNPAQPRKHFDAALLQELAASIRTQGVLQPIIVTPHGVTPHGVTPHGVTPHGRANGQPRRYLIVAGERRWKAAQLAGLQEVPVVVRHDIPAEKQLELALIENIQRADLNPIEEARAYADLMNLHGYTQEALGEAVGKDRSTVSNAMRLLKLPPSVQELVLVGRLSMGHARALLGLSHEDAMSAMAAEVSRAGMSVRATEAAVRKQLADTPEPAASDEDARRKIIVSELETRLRRRLGARVRLRAGAKRGSGAVEIPYSDLDELDRLLKIILA